MRGEDEIFKDLEKLCTGEGFIFALAEISLKNNFVEFDVNLGLNQDKLLEKDGPNFLIRSEMSTLSGLVAKKKLSFKYLGAEETQKMILKAEDLLRELQSSMISYWKYNAESLEEFSMEKILKGDGAREPIFYCAESAYDFQYLSLAVEKFAKDREWMQDNLGFSVEDCARICSASHMAQQLRMTYLFNMVDGGLEASSLLWAMMTPFSEIAEMTNIPVNTVRKIIEKFQIKESDNDGFSGIKDVNFFRAKPIFKVDNEHFLVIHHYNFAEAIYESPFYWMLEDKIYREKSFENRGAFSEEFIFKKMSDVFGDKNVFRNVNLMGSKKKTEGEVDVLVVYGGNALIFQCKSKRLNLESRKGNDLSIKKDFKLAVSDSYTQARFCAEYIENGNAKEILRKLTGRDKLEIKNIYLICTVLDHYPALSIQVKSFLEEKPETKLIRNPIVTDIFFIDVLVEFLKNPVFMLKFIETRCKFHRKLVSDNEIALLGLFLAGEFWIGQDHDMMFIPSKVGANVDTAMIVRRQGVPGEGTPTGVLTRYINTPAEIIINKLSSIENDACIDVSGRIFELDSDSFDKVSDYIMKCKEKVAHDGLVHDFSFCFDDFGFTFHFVKERGINDRPRLENHCGKKSKEMSLEWLGICWNSTEEVLLGIVEIRKAP